MTEVDSGIPPNGRGASSAQAAGCFRFQAVSDVHGRIADFRCVDLDAGARGLMRSLGPGASLRGRGGSGLLDLKACLDVLETGRSHDRELFAGRGGQRRIFSAALVREDPGLALRLRELAPETGRRCVPGRLHTSALRMQPGDVGVPTAGLIVPEAATGNPHPSSYRDTRGPAVWEWFPARREGSWSPGAEGLFGLAPGALRADPEWLLACIDPLQREEIGATLRRVLTRGGGFSLRYRFLAAGDAVRQHALAGRVDFDPARGPRLVAVLTEPDARSEGLHEDRVTLLREVAREVVWDWSPDGERIAWGETLSSVLGWSPGPERDLAWWKRTMHPDDRARVSASLERAVAGGDAHWKEEYRFARGDGGGWTPIQDRAYLVRDAAGKLVRIVGCMSDTTESKLAERARHREATFRERFIGILGHDLRTPLNAISLSAQTLRRRTPLTDTQREVVGRIQSSTARMERMITEILDLTRARLAGGIPVRPAHCDVHALTRRVLKELQAAHPDRPFTFDVRGPGNASVDAERLEQAVGNLVSNACQHSPMGLPITVESHTAEGAWVLRVHNEGPAIAAERLAEIFEPFRSGAAPQGVRSGAGLGLGLFIVREIAQAHGGSVEVHSTASSGTRFVLSLPLVPGGLP